jgi:hypothetical protein
MGLQSKFRPPRRISSASPGLSAWLDELWRAVDGLCRWRDTLDKRKENRPFIKVKVCVQDAEGNNVERDAFVMGYLLPEDE